MKLIESINGNELYESNYQNNLDLTTHNMVLSNPNIIIKTNDSANNYPWADATVRGLIDFKPWMDEYFKETNSIFRSKSLLDYLDGGYSFITEGNANLYWNLGNWVYTSKKLSKHYREILNSKNVALVNKNNNYNIETVDFSSDNPFENIVWAVSGNLLIHSGMPIKSSDNNPLTGRKNYTDYYGDLSQLLNTGFCVPLNKKLFYSNVNIEDSNIDLDLMSTYSKQVFNEDILNKFSKSLTDSKIIEAALNSEIINLDLSEYNSKYCNNIIENLEHFGYEVKDLEKSNSSGYFIENDTLNIRLKKSTFGHSVVSVCQDSSLLLTKMYTDNSRKGVSIDNMSYVVMESADKLGLKIKDSIVVSNGGDLRVYSANSGLFSHSKNGNLLTFKGEEDFGITSAFIIR